MDEILDATDTIAPQTRHKLGAEPTTIWEPVFKVGNHVRPDEIETKLDKGLRWIAEQSGNAKTHLSWRHHGCPPCAPRNWTKAYLGPTLQWLRPDAGGEAPYMH